MTDTCKNCGVPLQDGEKCRPSAQNCIKLMEFYEKFDKNYYN